MKTLVLLVTLLPWASAASASAAQGACDKMAPRTDGWEQIAEPDNAPDLLALANAERSEDALWYKSASGVVRACVYEYCGSLGYDFVQVAVLGPAASTFLPCAMSAVGPNHSFKPTPLRGAA